MNNPPFEIIECTRSSFQELTGDDMMTFEVTVKTDSYSQWVIVSFDYLMRYCQQHRPEIGAYYSSVRRNIKGLGPKHSKMMDIMDEEGFDHLPHIHAYIADNCDLNLAHQREEELRKNPPNPKQVSKKVQSLESHFPSMRESRLRNDAFMDDLMEHLNNEALERFPEIFNSDPELIEEFHDKLIRWVRTIGGDLDSLSFKAGKK
ncbi:MAG: hypothetical protein KBF73_08590 [Flavobacteriales bacterium]|nr:hypothetical protein [Flavobacteriales bacterium]